MGYDLRSEFILRLHRLGYSGLTNVGYVSKAFLEEQRQLRTQPGPKKRTFDWDYMGHMGHVIAVSTKRVHDRIKAQHIFLLDPSGKVFLYQALDGGEFKRFAEIGAPPQHIQEDPVDRILIEAYGL